jgi:hyperosmotically inducible protein
VGLRGRENPLNAASGAGYPQLAGIFRCDDKGSVFMKLSKSCLLVLLAAAMPGGCASLVVGGAAGDRSQTAQDTRSAGEISNDARITSSINTKYVNDDLVSALDVNVVTYRGVVTLSGSVPSQLAASRAFELARKTSNVKRVISRIAVTP